jgi:hypothetical protein
LLIKQQEEGTLEVKEAMEAEEEVEVHHCYCHH